MIEVTTTGATGEIVRAWHHRRFGGPEVLELVTLAKPVPAPDEVLVKILATTVSSADWRALSHSFPSGLSLPASLIFGFSKPRHPILGNEFCGLVEAVGDKVTGFTRGDRVVGQTGLRFGTHAEYVSVIADQSLVPAPAALSDEEGAAMSFGGMTVLGFLGKQRLAAGEDLLVNGASGTVGTAAIQIAKAYGAVVTAVCSAANAQFVMSLGADYVVDYARTDFTNIGRKWDVIIDAAGTAPFQRAHHALSPTGRLLRVNGGAGDMLRRPFTALAGKQRLVVFAASIGYNAMAELVRLVEQGAFRPVVGKVYPFADVAAAYRDVATGHKQGSVVLRVSDQQ